MSSKNVGILKAEPRKTLGTRTARALRAEGRIPAMIEVQEGKPHVDLSIDEAEFLATRRRHQHVYEIQLDGKAETALVQHLDWNVFGERVDHVEFRRVDLTKKTDVEVEISFVGHSKGVLNHLITHVKVRALPLDIPDEIEVSVADLEIGAAVFASAMKIPANVELVTPKETLVARISELKVDLGPEPTVEAAATAEGTAAAGTVPSAGAAPAAGAPAAAGAAKGAPAGDKKAPGGDKKGGDKK